MLVRDGRRLSKYNLVLFVDFVVLSGLGFKLGTYGVVVLVILSGYIIDLLIRFLIR